MYWMTSLWPWPKVTALCMIKWEPLTQSLQHLVATPLGHVYHLVKFWRNYVENFFLNVGCDFSRSNTIDHILGMVGQIDMKQKGSILVGYFVNYVTLTFSLTHDPDLGFFKVKFWNSCMLMWTEANRLDTRLNIWPFPLTIPMTLAMNWGLWGFSDFTQILAYLVHNMSRSQLHLGFGHFGWLPPFLGQ